MKRNKALLLSLGVVSAVVVPTFVVMSCGAIVINQKPTGPISNADQVKMNKITLEMVKTAAYDHLKPESEKGVPTTKPKDWKTTINELVGVDVHIDTWTPDKGQTGSVNMDIVILKAGLASTIPFQNIEVTGFAINNLHKMDGITSDMVKHDIIGELNPELSQSAPADVPDEWITNLNYLDGITVEIRSWSVNEDGEATMDVRLSADAVSERLFTSITISGWKSSNQVKMNKITKAMVTQSITQKIGAPTGQIAPDKPFNWTESLAGLSKVNISVSNWVVKDDGSITMTAGVSKGSLTPPPNSPFSITIKGYKSSNQDKMDKITGQMIHDVIAKVLAPNDSTPVPPMPSPITTTVGGLDNVTITISSWNPSDGSVTMTASFSRPGVTPATRSFPVTISGFKANQNTKFESLTKSDVTTEIQNHIHPDGSTDAPATQSGWTTPSLKGVTDVTIAFTSWVNNNDGTVKANVTLTKAKTTPRLFTDIKITGYKALNQQKMNGIGIDEVKAKIIAHLSPSSQKAIPATTPKSWSETLNGLDDVMIHLGSWQPKSDGSVTMEASFTKASLTPPSPIAITITGYQTSQQDNFDGISFDDVKKLIRDRLSPSPNNNVPNTPPIIRGTLNNVDNVDVSISGWTNNNDGSVTMNATISKAGVTPRTSVFTGITITGFLTTDNANFNLINSPEVRSEIINKLGSASGAIPANPNAWTLAHSIGNVDGVTITINKWEPNLTLGKILIDASVSKGTYTARKFSGIEISGYTPGNQQQVALNTITKEEVATAIHNQLGPQLFNNVPAAVIPDFKVQLGGLRDANVALSNWSPGDDGSVTMNATISKDKLIPKSFSDINISGFGHRLMTTASHVNSIPNEAQGGFSQKIDATHYFLGTLTRGLWQVTTGTGAQAGQVIKADGIRMDVIPDTQEGFMQKVDATHFLLGTRDGSLYQLTVDVNRPYSWLTVIDKVNAANYIPSVTDGFIQQVDPTHYLIGTTNNGVYQITTGTGSNVGKVIGSSHVKQIPDVGKGYIYKINSTHYAIVATDGHVWNVTTGESTLTGIVINAWQLPFTSIPFALDGWAQRIDATHFWIATQEGSLWTVTTDSYGTIIHTKKVTSPFVPQLRGGWAQQIDATHFIIGTTFLGAYLVSMYSPTQVARVEPISTSVIPNVKWGWAQKIANTNHYLIGTTDNGVYDATISFFS